MNVKISQEKVNEHAFLKSKNLKEDAPGKFNMYDKLLKGISSKHNMTNHLHNH